MTDIYIDPSIAGPGSGTLGDPYSAWSSVTFIAGNRYLQKRGTTYSGNVVVTTSGTSASAKVILGAYGQGDRPIIANPGNTNPCIDISNREWVEVSDFVLVGTAGTGTAKGLLAQHTSASRGSHIRIKRVDAINAKGTGISIVNYRTGNAAAPVVDLLVEDCYAAGCGGAGMSITGKVDDAVFSRCTSYNNGLTADQYGIACSAIKQIIPAGAAGWTLVSGTVYSRTPAIPSITGTVDYIAAVSIASDIYGDFLTENVATPASPLSGQYGFSGGLLYVNLGVSSASFPEVRVAADFCRVRFDECIATYQNKVLSEGYGIAADDMSIATFRRCYSANNEGYGYSMHRNKNSMMCGCVAESNYGSGMRVIGSRDSSVLHSTFKNNAVGINVAAGATGVTVKNNIVIDNATAGINARTGTTVDHNCYYNNGASLTGGATDGGGNVTENPLLDSEFKPADGSPVIAAGVYAGVVGAIGKDGRRFRLPAPTIGAFEKNPRGHICLT